MSHDLAALARIYGDTLLQQDAAFVAEQAVGQTASVAVLGQFKRGKSTLLNALLAENVLPTGRLPLTGVMTRIRYGETASLTVHYDDGREIAADLLDLPAYVTEERNPRNRLGVTYVDVALPLPLLHDMLLIDTPGIGSTLTHNTRTAQEASERVDLALFVTGPEPPITSEELAFLREVQGLADRVIVVVAKIDVVPDAEPEVLAFTRSVVSEALDRDIPLHAVNGTRPDERIDALREAITQAVTENGRMLARRSRARRVQRLASRIRSSMELRRAAALLPVETRNRARLVFAELADEIDERGTDLIRAIEQFPSEELVSIDTLLDTLVEQAAPVMRGEIEGFVARGPAQGERELHARIAEHEAMWSAQVSSCLERRIDKRKRSMLRLLTELERRFVEAGNKALGLEWDETSDDDRQEFGAREAATRMSGPVPTTGLELVTGGILATLPGPLRSRALRKRFHALAIELLDRSKGRIRSAAVRYLLEWRLANVVLVRDRLAGARKLVEDAFADANDGSDETKAGLRVREIERDERILDAIVAAFD